MGVAFDRWLGRPSTACFLRRLLAATCEDGSASISGHSPHHRRAINTGTLRIRKIGGTSTATAQPRNEGGRSSLPVAKEAVQQAADHQELALRMSLNAGTELLEPHATPEQSFETLRRQADLATAQIDGQLAVDRPENAGNYKLWVELLQYRQRLDGARGVLHVWNGLRQRDLDLPVLGREADVLWKAFIDAGIRSHGSRSRLVQSVIGYAEDLYERSHTQYPGLHRCIVGRILRVWPAWAWSYHEKLVAKFGTEHVDLGLLAEDCANSKRPMTAKKVFTRIHSSLKPGPMYDVFMAEMLKCEDERLVLEWHKFFVENGDFPSLEMASTPEIQRLMEVTKGSMPTALRKHIASASGGARQELLQYLPLTRAKMSTIVGDVHGIKQKELGDSFVAKMFATQAFPLDMVIKGLEFFGVDKLGPLALREMALKAGNFAEFAKRLDVVKAKGIALDSSVYGRLVQKLTTEGSVQLFDTLIQSDQHPESYADVETQELLLVKYLENGDWFHAHLILMGLSLSGHFEHSRAWNRLFQGYIKARDYRAAVRTAQHMQASTMAFTRRTLTFLHRYLLPTRQRGQSPEISLAEAHGLDPLQFTTNAYIYAAKCGVAVNVLLWKENLKRYGMTHRWDELERLVLWLVENYSATLRPRAYKLHGRIFQPKGMLQLIFGRQMRQALVTWAFRQAWHGASEESHRKSRPASHSLYDKNRTCEPWARGLVLLKRMGNYGVPTTPETARHAFIMRMWILFGPAVSKEGPNEKIRLHNKLPLAHFVKHANEIWDGKLFNFDPELLNDNPQSHARLMTALFGRRRPVNKSKGRKADWADVERFAEAQAEHGLTTQSSSRSILKKRLAMWRRSPYRLVRATEHEIQSKRGDAP